MVDHRRHGVAEEGAPLGWRCATIRLGSWQDRQLSVSGFGDTGIARGAGDGGSSAISAGYLDERSDSVRQRGGNWGVKGWAIDHAAAVVISTFLASSKTGANSAMA